MLNIGMSNMTIRLLSTLNCGFDFGLKITQMVLSIVKVIFEKNLNCFVGYQLLMITDIPF